MRRQLVCRLAALLLCVAAPVAPAQVASVLSPDGRLEVSVDLLDLGDEVARYPQGKRLYYEVRRDGLPVIEWSPLGLVLSDRDCLDNLQIRRISNTRFSRNYSLVAGKQKQQQARANQLRINIGNGVDAACGIRFRVFDDGVAYRYEARGSGEVSVVAEHSGFHLPRDASTWLGAALWPDMEFFPGFEPYYRPGLAGVDSPLDGYYLPALFGLADQQTFVLLHESGLTENYAASRLDSDASDAVYMMRFPSAGEGAPAQPVLPSFALPLQTPWRVAVIGGLADLVETGIITHLSPDLHPVFNGDTGWIRPGKAAWSFLSQETGDPALQREYVDSAAAFGWDYVLVDWGWYEWAERDAELAALASYANQRDIGILLWYNAGGEANQIPFQPRDRLDDLDEMRAEFAQLAAAGVAGVKVDFFRSGKQARIRQMRHILQAAAEHALVVNFHGAITPRGWQREFPNLLTSEGVLGAEWYLFDLPGFSPPYALDNVQHSFMRNVVGSMDYTPLLFSQPLAMVGISYAHQLALATLFESGIQHFAEQADSTPDAGFNALFADFPFVRDHLQRLPASWDETRFVAGNPASHSVIARRSGEHWYLAGVSAAYLPIDVNIDLSTFATGFYRADYIEEGPQADQLTHRVEYADSADTLTVTLPPQSGFSLVLRPAAEFSPFRDDPLDGRWRVSPWLGHVDDSRYPWLEHREHGQWQVLEESGGVFSLSSEKDGLLSIVDISYPVMFDVGNESWLYYFPDSSRPRVFYNYTSASFEFRR